MAVNLAPRFCWRPVQDFQHITFDVRQLVATDDTFEDIKTMLPVGLGNIRM